MVYSPPQVHDDPRTLKSAVEEEAMLTHTVLGEHLLKAMSAYWCQQIAGTPHRTVNHEAAESLMVKG